MYFTTRIKHLIRLLFNILFVLICVVLLMFWIILYPILLFRYNKNKNIFQHPSFILFVWFKKLQKLF